MQIKSKHTSQQLGSLLQNPAPHTPCGNSIAPENDWKSAMLCVAVPIQDIQTVAWFPSEFPRTFVVKLEGSREA